MCSLGALKEQFIMRISIFLIIVGSASAFAREYPWLIPDTHDGVFLGSWACRVFVNAPNSEHDCIPSFQKDMIALDPDEKWSPRIYKIVPQKQAKTNCMLYEEKFFFKRTACKCYFDCGNSRKIQINGPKKRKSSTNCPNLSGS